MTYKIVVFTGVGCAPCKALKEKLSAEFIGFEEMPVMQNMRFAQEMGVKSVPTTVVYVDSELVGTVVGNKVEEIKEMING